MTRTAGQKRPEDALPTTRAMTLRLDGPLADRLNLAALATDQAASDVIREGLRAHLRRLEADPFLRARYAELRAALPDPAGGDG